MIPDLERASMLDRVFEMLAPRSLGDGVLKGTLVMALAILLHFAVDYGLDGYLWMPPADLILTTILVGLPFLVLMMTALAYFKRLELRLFAFSRTDPLTGLPNRHAFFEEAAARLELCKGGAVLLVDVDRFKRINDTFGHETGDHCLKAVADHLHAITRSGDLVARIGGEEFAFYFPKMSAEGVHSIESRLCRTLNIPAPSGDHAVPVTVSAGAAIVTDRQSVEVLLARADEALYRAKHSGRARLKFWSETRDDPGLHEDIAIHPAA